jgi:aryl-alcohol dehydrogenase-like predicted oxidoreductase
MNSRLVLGTAQLGLSYGIANKNGQPDLPLATEIIRAAWENGIQEFDTAQGYGESEHVLGKALLQLGLSGKAKVITKLHPQLDHLNPDILEHAVAASLKNIGVPQIYGIMLHREETLSLWPRGLAEILSKLSAQGMFQKVGVSVYAPEKAIDAINTKGMDLIQVPTNILDRRFEKAGVFELAHDKNKQVYIRSVFLQGLLLMPPDEIPGPMLFAKPVVEKVHSLAKILNLSMGELALGYMKHAIPDAKIIFGAETVAQVKENCDSWSKAMPPSIINHVRNSFDRVDDDLLNPTQWPT